MGRLLGWHTRVGELGLRWLQLHLLWIGWTLAGGVVLGVFPATAAVNAVLRRDHLRGTDDGTREPLRREFAGFVRAERRTANVLGWTVTALWAVLLFDRHLLSVLDLGPLHPVLAGLLWVVTAFAFLATSTLPVLAVHYDERPATLLRRSAVNVLARPHHALLHAVAVGAVLSGYYVLPGLVPVFGTVLPAAASLAALRAGDLLRPPAPQPAAS